MAGDENLMAENIKKGVKLFGITGTYEQSLSAYGIDYGTVTITTDSANITVNHRLNQTPIRMILLSESIVNADIYSLTSDKYTVYSVHLLTKGPENGGAAKYLYGKPDISIAISRISGEINADANEISFHLGQENAPYTFPSGTYYWFALNS